MKKLLKTLILTLSFHLVIAQPKIDSIVPAAAEIGDTVTIHGSGFSLTGNQVYFGPVKGTAFDFTSNQVKSIVPSGALTDLVSIISGNLTAYSPDIFNPLFPGTTGSFSQASFLPVEKIAVGFIIPYEPLPGDFNLDGKTDMVLGLSSGLDSLFIYQNAGAGNSISFAPRKSLAANGNQHRSGEVADFDGDGKLDIIQTNNNSVNGSISVFRNISVIGGNIAFDPRQDYGLMNDPYDACIGDFNSDGKPDLAISHKGAAKISIFINSSVVGTIAFNPQIDIATINKPLGLEAADLDNDGKVDIAYSTEPFYTYQFYVLRNTSTSSSVSFDLPLEVPLAPVSSHIKIVDLDGDKKKDLIVLGSPIRIVRNTSANGVISFGLGPLIYTGTPSSLAFNDMDGDGRGDIIISNPHDSTVSIFRNLSTPGNWITFSNEERFYVGGDPNNIAVADLDLDGKADIITPLQSRFSFSILRNIVGQNITPTIASFTPQSGVQGTVVNITGTNFINVTGVFIGDTALATYTVNSPNSITGVVGGGASGMVKVKTKTGSFALGNFNFLGPVIKSFSPKMGNPGTVVTIKGTNLSTVTQVTFGAIAAGSFTILSDTTISAVVGSGATGLIRVVSATGTGSIDGFSFNVPRFTDFNPKSAKVGDTINITGLYFEPTLSNNLVYFGGVRGTVVSGSGSNLMVKVPAGAEHSQISLSIRGLKVQSKQFFNPVFPGINKAITGNSFFPVLTYQSNGGATPVVEDLNDDGKLDILLPNPALNVVSVYPNNSSGTVISLGARLDFPTGKNPVKIDVGDLNGDNKKDVIVANFNPDGSSISILKNESNAGIVILNSHLEIETDYGTSTVAVADMDGDGKLDLLTGNYTSSIFYYQNTSPTSGGAISFGPRKEVNFFFRVRDMVICDIDLDGKQDLVTSNWSSNSIAIFINKSENGVFSYQPVQTYFIPSTPGSISAADIDGNGKTDIIVHYGSGIAYMINNYSSLSTIFTGSVYKVSPFMHNYPYDLNGDNKIDLAVGFNSGNAGAIENIYSGSWQSIYDSIMQYPVNHLNNLVAAGDLDGDGKGEIIVSSVTGLTILKNNVGAVATSLPDPAVTLGVKVYPNPAKGKLFVGWDLARERTLHAEITNTSGQKVFSQNNIESGKSINISSLPAGVYFLNLTNGKGKQLGTVKFVN